MTPHALIAPARLAGQPVLQTQSDERLVDLVRAGCESSRDESVSSGSGSGSSGSGSSGSGSGSSGSDSN